MTEPETQLHPKHEQLLVSAFNNADWTYDTLSEDQFIEPPSTLKSVVSDLRNVLTDVGVIEHSFVCSQCGHSEWRSEVDVGMTAAATRTVKD